jgi:YidC/Oxa1 family membrane protein insertase
VVTPGETQSYENRLFAGAKRLELLETYETELGIEHFDLAIDFGMWYFLTKPFYYALTFFYDIAGNFGIAILMLTLILRVLVFPFANMSYRSFANMRKIAPAMKELRERHGDDKVKLQEELVALYQREKVNPMAGCLPILLQIPIFFALYKVLQISIEMRHAPFFGWIEDLSARDPTSVFNLFGLLPYDVPAFLLIGAWPCMMLATMIMQRSMSPPPQDKTQAMMINILPWFMTFIMSRFAAGLVIYWTFSSAFGVIQQYIIMRSLGVEVKFFQRSPKDKEMEDEVMDGPSIHPGLETASKDIEEALFGEEEQKEPPKPVSPPKPKKKKKKK